MLNKPKRRIYFDPYIVSMVATPIVLITLLIVGLVYGEHTRGYQNPQKEFCKELTAENMSCDWSSEELPVLGLYYMETYGMSSRDAMHKAGKVLKGVK